MNTVNKLDDANKAAADAMTKPDLTDDEVKDLIVTEMGEEIEETNKTVTDTVNKSDEDYCKLNALYAAEAGDDSYRIEVNAQLPWCSGLLRLRDLRNLARNEPLKTQTICCEPLASLPLAALEEVLADFRHPHTGVEPHQLVELAYVVEAVGVEGTKPTACAYADVVVKPKPGGEELTSS